MTICYNSSLDEAGCNAASGENWYIYWYQELNGGNGLCIDFQADWGMMTASGCTGEGEGWTWHQARSWEEG